MQVIIVIKPSKALL